MTPPAAPPETPAPAHGESHVSPGSDLIAAFAWMVFGIAVLIASLRMDRLEKQDINPYTIPGLLPGLLGIVTILLGFLLALRSWRRRVAHPEQVMVRASVAEKKRVLLVLALCLVFGIGLVGHGLPFWAAAWIFVTVAILSLQHSQRKAAGQGLTLRTVAKALAIGLGAGLMITLVFQELFLVHLP
ncbi:tripartite tricarboxylate transporter TctB family protein [Variovorax sp. PBL-E5]|uniref:tripartite tricarboxylate transporter TctB family protein n=1 Tax=Variovorax sp. PBL-E5 TaxID=434014 RepID=UPI0013196C8E|nr:tripartite tricarboxylate transporter TctB family protein [Variovorax sp. PBL-E5]VTU24717.1 Tripartite tricarboxylate transporter TctB family protein [Variovorax sp. PBL-E5]